MTWQKYKLNLRNPLLLGDFFRLWSNLMLFSSNHRFHLGIEMHYVFGYQYSEILDHAFLVKPAYYLKSLCKQNPTKPYRLRI